LVISSTSAQGASHRDPAPALGVQGGPRSLAGLAGREAAACRGAAMTGLIRSATASAMLRRFWLLTLCLLASSLMATATVHAQERFGTVETCCGGAACADRDADPLPADGDQPAPDHHGSCHGHNLTAEVATPALAPSLAAGEPPAAARAVRLARRTVDPALRPPEA
jgi:hypothetical protein